MTMLKNLFRQLRSDWVRIFMALVLAGLLYLQRSDFFTTAVETKDINNIPVEFVYADPNLVNIDDKEHTLNITFEGSPNRISALDAAKVSVKVNIDRRHLEDGLIKIEAKDVSLPSGIRVKRIHNPHITVNLEEMTSKKVPVKIVFANQDSLAEGYSVSKVVPFPAEVMISGAKSKISNIDSVNSAPIPLDNSIRNNFKYTANIDIGSGVDAAPSKVDCEIFINRKFSKRVIKNIPILIMHEGSKNPDIEYSLNIKDADIEVSGPTSIVHFRSEKDFDVYVNAKNFNTPGEYKVNVYCTAHAGDLQIISVNPSNLLLEVRKKTVKK